MSSVNSASPKENVSKVLLVDDSRFLRTANERTLLKAGYNVEVAPDGEEALELAAQAKYDLIILEVIIP
ncbi:MAG TPA: response regulator [Terriglobales bacterium]|nr:response regulator [Terriglobales bacterium]